MRIDQAQARLAPRNAWQAMDLGVALWRQWWLPLLGIWLTCTLIPLAILLVVFTERPWLAGLVFWWLKPLWDRPLLEYQARALFGERPGIRQLLRELPGYAGSGLAGLLTWRRPSPWRAFHLPVFQLERATGRTRSRRLALLHRAPASRAGLMTIVMLHLEQAFAFALLTLLWILLPWQFNVEWMEWLTQTADQHLSVVCWYLAMTLIEPIYVACGFALYLNQRSHLEAWDLEPAMRRIARRRGVGAAAAVVVLVLPLAAGLLPEQSRANEQLDPSREATEILAHPDFMPMSERSSWRLQRDEPATDSDWLRRALEWLLEREGRDTGAPLRLPDGIHYLIIALVLAAGVTLLWRARHRLALPESRDDRRSTVRIARDRPAPALPEDLPAAVEAALARDDTRAALSLLYRATFERLRALEPDLPPGATEEEVLRLAPPDFPLVQELTRLWTATAWAHRPARPETVREILEQWRRQFAGETGE